MPLATAVKFDELLTNISIQYQPTQGEFLADRVLPPVPVAKESAAYWVYDNSRFDTPDSKRKPRSAFNRIDWTVSTDTYLCEQYGLEGEIDDDERTNAAGPLDLDVDTTEIVTDMVLLNRERRVAALVFSTGTVTQNVTLSGTTQWTDQTNSTPLDDVKTARLTIFNATGYMPNKMLINQSVFEALKLHPEIKEIVKYTERALITKAILAAIFEVDEVLVGGVRRRSSKEGQTDAMTDIWGNHCLLFFSEQRPSLKKASFGYQMRQDELRVFRYRKDEINTDVIRVSEKQDEKIVSATLAYLIKDAAA